MVTKVQRGGTGDKRRVVVHTQAFIFSDVYCALRAPTPLAFLRVLTKTATYRSRGSTGAIFRQVIEINRLLESCLADKLAFVERTRRLIRRTIESKHALKLAA